MTSSPLNGTGYYFGCIDGPGHFFWHRAGGRLRHVGGPLHPEKIVPWGLGVDWKLTNGSDVQGAASLHHKDGWTALAFADRSVDSRGHSNSVFCFRGRLDFDTALAEARKQFPEIFSRFDFEIVEASA